MIYLDKLVRLVLLEEGQTLISLEDLGITKTDIEDLFKGVYEQSRPYAQNYIRKTLMSSMSGITIPDAVAIKRVTYNIYGKFIRPVSDIPDNMWDFDPHTKEFRTLASSSYIVEYLSYPECDYVNLSETYTPKNGKVTFTLPCKVDEDTFRLTQGTLYSTCTRNSSDDGWTVSGTLGNGTIGEDLRGSITLSQSATTDLVSMTAVTKFLAIEEWDMKIEIFMVWFKAALLSLIGAIKEQSGNLDPAIMPFDVNRDSLLGRARELWAKVEELKASQSVWYEFS